MKQKVLVIAGPTAVGKTALSIKAAQICHGEVISGDSMQVYKKLDIGTAKATAEEMAGIPHHLIDIKDITETYSVHEFQQSGRKLIDDIAKRGKLPIVAGGTGLYIQALLFDFTLGGAEMNQSDTDLRRSLTAFAEECGNQALWEKLQAIDSAAAQSIHPNNRKRVVRAIEVMQQTGKSILQSGRPDFKELRHSLYDVKLIGLTTDRETLYQRINRRVDVMMASGLPEEARLLYETPDVQAAQGIGYKELFPYFDGTASLESCIDAIKKQSRHYAKRQLTWFRNRMNAQWWDIVDNPERQEELLASIQSWQADETEMEET